MPTWLRRPTPSRLPETSRLTEPRRRRSGFFPSAGFLLLAAFLPLFGGCGGAAEAVEADDRPVALVTGSTDGLGRALALALGEAGYRVIVHGRNAERGAQVVAELDGASFLAADFASLAQVRSLAAAILEAETRLDLLVNNAGIGPGAPGHSRMLTDDGHELRFQVNYLAGYLLTRELLPLLEAAASAGGSPRIVNVTSRNQRSIDLDDLALEVGYNGGEAYGRSKLAQILHVQDLAEALAPRGITAVAVHPAPAMDTELVREAGGTPASTVADGLASVLHAIRAPVPSGTFFFEQEIRPAHDQAYDAGFRRRLQERVEALVNAGAPF